MFLYLNILEYPMWSQIVLTVLFCYLGTCLGSFIHVQFFRKYEYDDIVQKLTNREIVAKHTMEESLSQLEGYKVNINTSPTSTKFYEGYEQAIQKYSKCLLEYKKIQQEVEELQSKAQDKQSDATSHCDSCGHRLSYLDMIPLLSYTISRGKCRYCKAKIPATHFTSELIMGLCFLTTWIVATTPIKLIGLLVAVSMLGVVAIQDSIAMEMSPIWLIVSYALFSGITCYYVGLTFWTVSVCVGTFMLLIASVFCPDSDKIGSGDILAFAYVGGVTTLLSNAFMNFAFVDEAPNEVLWVTLVITYTVGIALTMAAGGIIGILLNFKTVVKGNTDKPIPFIPLLTLGFLVTLVILQFGYLDIFVISFY